MATVSKQDKTHVRTASELERKLNVKKSFSETVGLINETRKTVDDVVKNLVMSAIKKADEISEKLINVYEAEITLTGEVIPFGGLEINKPIARKNAYGLVEISGIISPSGVNSGIGTESGVNIFTLPEGYRPYNEISQICKGGGRCIWLLTVKPNGEVWASGYQSGAEYAVPDSSARLMFCFDYFAKKKESEDNEK